jgi:hypothetical protein
VEPSVASTIGTIVAVGESAAAELRSFRRTLGDTTPDQRPSPLGPGEALVWCPHSGAEATRFRILDTRSDRRGRRSDAGADLGRERSFYFRGVSGKLNLRAQNVTLFVQIAEGLDDETWEHHRLRGDYSRWFREALQDEELATEAARIESSADLPARESKAGIRALIERRYALPPSQVETPAARSFPP